MIEFRIGWSASSNILFRGESDWMEWEGFEETEDEVEDILNKGGIPDGLEMAIEFSGFEWWAETRTVDE